jgi:hypothetical protein
MHNTSRSNHNTKPGPGFRLLFSVVLLTAVLSFSLPSVQAQVASGSITGTVTDSSGAVLPEAKVILRNEATNAQRETATNGAGIFSFPSVQPGSYTVNISFAGLQTAERRGIALTQGAVLTLGTIALEVATAMQEIQVVSAGDVIVPVDSGTISQTLNRQMVEDLSIVGRNAAELIKIMPGVAMARGLNNRMWNSYTTASNTGPIGEFSAGGTQPNGAMTMTSDGANLLDPGNQGTQTANINQNQVQEVSILTSAYGAEFAKGPMTFQAIGQERRRAVPRWGLSVCPTRQVQFGGLLQQEPGWETAGRQVFLSGRRHRWTGDHSENRI